KVERSPDGVSGWVQVSTTAAGVTALGNGALAPGTTYYYRVRATSAAGDSPYSGVAGAATPAGSAPLFADGFDAGGLGGARATRNGSWSVAGGVLGQSSTAAALLRKAVVAGQSFPATAQVTARVRVDSWADGDGARAGVGLFTDPSTGQGYNLVFPSRHGR